MEHFLYRCKLFFRALNEGRTSFFFSDAPKWLHSDGGFFPQYVRAPLHGLYGEYSWDQKDTDKIIKLIIEKLSQVYPSYFTKEMASIDHTNRNNWITFNSSQNLSNRFEANLQNELVKNSNSLFPKNWLLGFKFLYKYDWHPVPNRPDKGRNDIILTNGKGIFVVVEAKFINSYTDKYQKLRDVKRQAVEYKTMFLEHFADDPAVIAVIGVWFTNENYLIGFSSDIDKAIAKAVEPVNPHLLGYLSILRGILGLPLITFFILFLYRIIFPNFYWNNVCNLLWSISPYDRVTACDPLSHFEVRIFFDILLGVIIFTTTFFMALVQGKINSLTAL